MSRHLPPTTAAKSQRKPAWLRVRLPRDQRFADLDAALRELGLSTVCRSARCPNIGECFSNGTATSLILGEVCTRSCSFCNIASGRPEPPSPDEPQRLSKAVGRMGISHAVITSVTRDDLPDGGASHFARVVFRLKSDHPELCVETLIPNFLGDTRALAAVLESGVDILNHNVETVPEPYPLVRPPGRVPLQPGPAGGGAPGFGSAFQKRPDPGARRNQGTGPQCPGRSGPP